MKLRNKKTGEIIDLEQWRLEYYKSSGCITITNDKNQNEQFCYGAFADMKDEWEDVEPLIKDEKIRKAVRAWANSFDDVDEIKASDDYKEFWIDGYLIEFERSFNEVESEHTYRRTNIIELCGEEE